MSSKNKELLNARKKAILDSIDLGVSFSVKTCRDYSLNWQDCLQGLLAIGVRRFRMMSYWDLHEPTRGTYDFTLLDRQLAIAQQEGARVTLCLGIRQPRWPETHLPEWAIPLPEEQRTELYLAYQKAVIERYKGRECIESWQLENEFWNRSFGLNNTFSRKRLVAEFKQLRQLDASRPIIMSLANTFGLPLFTPKPDIFGTTLYLTQYANGRYSKTRYIPLYFRLRAALVKLIGLRPLIIHELQAEPWGPKANWEMDDKEQAMSMDSEKLKACIAFADRTGIKYKDLWGGEWWYWRKTARKDIELWTTIQSEVLDARSKVNLPPL